MNEAARNLTLKTGLLLVVLEGWVPAANIEARLGPGAAQALAWLAAHGFAERGEAGTYRWGAQEEFEALWSRLVPDRECPVRLRSESGRAHLR